MESINLLEIIENKDYDLSTIKALLIDCDSSVEIGNNFLIDHEEELSNLTVLTSKYPFVSTFIPKSVKILNCDNLCVETILELEELYLTNASQYSSKITITIDPIKIKKLMFTTTIYEIPNLKEMINLEELNIYGDYDFSNVQSKKLVSLAYYRGEGELPQTIKELSYILENYDYSFKYLEIDDFKLILTKNLECDVQNKYIKKISIWVETNEINKINLNFPSLEEVSINFKVNCSDLDNIFSFLTSYSQLKYLSLTGFDVRMSCRKELIFDYDIEKIFIHEIVVNVICKTHVFYTYGKLFNHKVLRMKYVSYDNEKEVEFDSETVEEISLKFKDDLSQIKFYCPNLKILIITNGKYWKKKYPEISKLYLISPHEFKIEVDDFENVEIYLNDKLIEKENNKED